VESPGLGEKLRSILDVQLSDARSAWEMQPDGSYVQRMPSAKQDARSSQQRMIEITEKRFKAATRLRRRKPAAIVRRRSR
jgi:polyphosphate kinase